MKNKIFILFSVFITLLLLTSCGKYNKTITLDNIVNSFNNSDTVTNYKEYGYELKAVNTDNKLIITSNIGNEVTETNFAVNDNILENEKLTNNDLMLAMMVINTIGELQGYKSGELTGNMNAFIDKYKKYSLEKEGFEFKDNGDTTSIKIDLSKKIPLIDSSLLYLKPEQFDMIKEIVLENSSGNQSGKISKLAYDISVGIDESYIYIGEEKKLTNSAYKSILSALEVMYGKNAADNFKELYPKFKRGVKSIGAFKVETNYKMDDKENTLFKDTKIVLVTIDNSKIK